MLPPLEAWVIEASVKTNAKITCSHHNLLNKTVSRSSYQYSQYQIQNLTGLAILKF